MKTISKNKGKIVGAYIRTSTSSQNEASQRRELTGWLERNGIENVEWYVDVGTGDNLDRAEFQRLQSDVFAGRVSMIVTYKVDRVARSMREGIDTVCDWCNAGVRLVATSQQLDFSGVIGKAMAAVLLAFGELEQQTRRDRQSAGIAAAREAGTYKGRKAGTFKARPTEALRLKNKGLTGDEIAKQLSCSRTSVMRYLKLASA